MTSEQPLPCWATLKSLPSLGLGVKWDLNQQMVEGRASFIVWGCSLGPILKIQKQRPREVALS